MLLVLLTAVARDRRLTCEHANGWFDTTFGYDAGVMPLAAADIGVSLVG